MQTPQQTILFLLLLFCGLAGQGQGAPNGHRVSEKRELTTGSHPYVTIESGGFDIIVNTWNEDKVGLTVEAEDPGTLPAGVSLLDAFHISLSGNAAHVRVLADWKSYEGSSLKKLADGKGGLRQVRLVVNLPALSRLLIDNRFSDIILNNPIEEADFRLVGGTLATFAIGKLKLHASLSEIRLGNITRAEVVLEGVPKFDAPRIETLLIKSSGSALTLGSGRHVHMESKIDNYHLGTIDTLVGSKVSGTLLVSSVSNKLDLEGYHSDMTFRSLSPELRYIQVLNRHAKVRIPLSTIKNLSLDFEGLQTVIHSPLDIVVPQVAATAERKSYGPPFAPKTFHFSRGTAEATKIRIACDACVVDLR